MKIDPNFIALTSLEKRWSVSQRKAYGLLDQQAAQDFLVYVTGKDYGDSLLRWSFYYLLQEQNSIGIKVLVGRMTGVTERYLQSMISFQGERTITSEYQTTGKR